MYEPSLIAIEDCATVNTRVSYSRRSTDPIYSYLQIKNASSCNERKIYTCKICLKVNALENAPTNIRRHLSCVRILSQVKIRYEDWKSRTIRIQTNVWDKYNTKSEVQNDYIDLCAKWIARDNRSISIVKDT